MLIFDAHLDLSMNALEWNRDLRWTVDEIRKSEAGQSQAKDQVKRLGTDREIDSIRLEPGTDQ